MKVAMIGGGAFGKALGGVLFENGYSVEYYDVKLDKTMQEVLDGAERVVLAVPSCVVPELILNLPKDRPLIVATKGILGAEMFRDFEDVMVVSGPGFAEDIVAHREVVLTATDERVVEMMTTGYLTFDQTTDVQGVLLCGALKNVYAILAGYQELARGSSEWERFITEVAEETQALVSANGGEAATVNLACGIGDLRLTCGLPSRNYEFGQMFRNDPQAQPDKTVEGWSTLERIKQGAIEVPETAVKLRFLMGQSSR